MLSTEHKSSQTTSLANNDTTFQIWMSVVSYMSINTPKPDRDKFLIIRINHSNAGFFAYVNFALNQLIYAEQHNLSPVVYFGPQSGDGPNAYFDPAIGENMWDYYFEPVATLTYTDIERRLSDPDDPLTLNDLTTLSVEELWRIHEAEPESIYPYPHGIHSDKFKSDPEWYSKQRSRGHCIINKYVRIKPHILAKVDAFEREHFAGNRVLGIHMRGTDKGSAKLSPELMRIVKPREYFQHIDEYTDRHGYCKIFVATEQEQFLHQITARYGDRVLSYQAMRTSGLRNPFQLAGNGYRKGEDVLIDCLLLSRSDYLLKCTSAVGEFAMYFNPKLACVDLNHRANEINSLQLLTVRLKNRAWRSYHGVCRRKGRERSGWLAAWLRYLLRAPGAM
jgi:Nodulation protein Z (NodZ)